MNDFDVQLLIAFVVMLVIFIPTYLYKYRKYNKEGKSTRYLEFKIGGAIAFPILTIMVLLRKDLPFTGKLFILLIAFIGMIAYAWFITSARRSFRKAMGLSLEDEGKKEHKEKDMR